MYRNLGFALRYFSNFEKAIEFLQQALSIAKEIKDKILHKSANEALGFVFASLGNSSKADEHFKSSIKVFEEIRDVQNKDEWKISFHERYEIYSSL